MDQKQKLKKAIELSKKLGLKFVQKTKKSVDHKYNNGICYIQVNSGELSTLDFVLHNLAHFMVASPERRFLADFGLGSSPDSPDQFLKPIIDSVESNKEERLCVLLSDYLANYLFSEKVNTTNHTFFEEKNNFLEYLGLIKNNEIQLKLREISDLGFLKWKKTF